MREIGQVAADQDERSKPMLNLKPYKGYTGYVRSLDPDTNLFHGRVASLDATIVTFEAATPAQLQIEFEASVDDYLAWALEDGFTPEKPATGTFQVRVKPQTHRNLMMEAELTGQKFNTVVAKHLDAAASIAAVEFGGAVARPARNRRAAAAGQPSARSKA
jgi:predicted HicB family RNase H-like nuclease